MCAHCVFGFFLKFFTQGMVRGWAVSCCHRDVCYNPPFMSP